MIEKVLSVTAIFLVIILFIFVKNAIAKKEKDIKRLGSEKDGMLKRIYEVEQILRNSER